MNKINFLFVTLFGIGKLKKIPGSYASLATTILLFFLFHVLYFSPNFVLIAIVILFFIVFPIFSYYRWKDKKIEDYYLNNENLRKFKENNDL